MKFIEYDRGYPFERGIGQKFAHEHSFGEESQARVAGGDVLEAELVAHASSDGFAPLFGHS